MTWNRIIGRKKVHAIVGMFVIFIFSSLSYGETDFGELLSIEDEGKLEEIIAKAKKTHEQNPKDKDSLITLGIAYHNLGDIGVKTGPKESVKYLKQAKKMFPDDPLILAMLGSSTTMMGKYHKNKVTEGRKLVGKGGGYLDNAVKMAPDNALVRMVRANNSRGLPSFFGRGHYYKEDLTHINELIDKSPSAFNNEFKAQVYYGLGRAYEGEGDKTLAKDLL